MLSQPHALICWDKKARVLSGLPSVAVDGFWCAKKTTMYLQMLFIHNEENIKADKVVWQWKTRTKFKLAETVYTLLADKKLVHKLDDSCTTPAAEWQADEALS